MLEGRLAFVLFVTLIGNTFLVQGSVTFDLGAHWCSEIWVFQLITSFIHSPCFGLGLQFEHVSLYKKYMKYCDLLTEPHRIWDTNIWFQRIHPSDPF